MPVILQIAEPIIESHIQDEANYSQFTFENKRAKLDSKIEFIDQIVRFFR